MPRFKRKISFKSESFEAASNYIANANDSTRNSGEQAELALAFARRAEERVAYPIPKAGVPWSSTAEQIFLKQLKHWVNLNNLKINKIGELIYKFSKENFASLREVQRDLLSLLSETSEEEIKLIGGYSQAHYNSFVRGVDAPMSWGDLSGLKDFKTGFAFNQKHLMEIMENAGLTLPIRERMSIPISDVYIVDELTDTGDSITPLQSSPCKNLLKKNKVFRHVIVRKEYDYFARSWSSRTSHDAFPNSCISTMTLEIELPSIAQINYLEFEPIGNSTIYIPEDGLSYKSPNGSEVSLSSMKISGEISTRLLFQPITTKYLRVKFEQYGSLGRTDIDVESKKITEINKLLNAAGMTSRHPASVKRVKGRVYDFSLSSIDVGLLAFEPRGIFRSGTPLPVDSPIGMSLSLSTEQISPVAAFDTYQNATSLPEGKALMEAYVGAKLYGGKLNASSVEAVAKALPMQSSVSAKDTLIMDSIFPVPDSYPVQMEYLEFVRDEAKAKLFPRVDPSERVSIESVHITRYEIDHISDGAAAIGALVLDKSPAEAKLLYDNLGIDSSGIPISEIGHLEIPAGRVFDGSNQEHVSAKALWVKAIESAVSPRRSDKTMPISLVFKAPSDDDLEYVMGNLWHRATPVLKDLIRLKPEDFLLLSTGAVWGGTKRFHAGEKVVFFTRTHLFSLEDPAMKTHLGQSLLNTKLLKITVESIENGAQGDIVNLSIEAVRNVMSKGKDELKHLCTKDRALVERFSEINYYANKYRENCYDLFTVGSAGQTTLFPKIDLSQESIDLQYSVNKYWDLYCHALLRSSPIIKSFTYENGLSTFKQTHGRAGTSSYEAAEALHGVSDFSKVDTERVLGVDSWYYDFAASKLNEPDHDKVVAKINNWLVGLPEDGRKPSVSPLPFSSELIASSWFGQTSQAYQRGLIGDFDESFTEDSFNLLSSFLKRRKVCLAWKFTTDKEHNFGIGDLVGFRSNPKGMLDGQQYIVGVEPDAFLVKMFNPDYSPVIKSISPDYCDYAGPYRGSVAFADITNPSLGAQGSPGCNVLGNCEEGCPEGYSCDDDRDSPHFGECVEENNNFKLTKPFEPWQSTKNQYWESDGRAFTGFGTDKHTVYTCGEDNLMAKALEQLPASDLNYTADGDLVTPEGVVSLKDATNICFECAGLDLVNTSIDVFKVGFVAPPIEIYEDDHALVIGEDYDISLDGGARWVGTYPVDGSYKFLTQKALAGLFLVRVYKQNPFSSYWAKYKVEPNQLLVDDGLVFLRNGRVACNEKLQEASGTLSTILIARTRSTNPYLTPLIRNFALKVEENTDALKKSGGLLTTRLLETKRMSTINVD